MTEDGMSALIKEWGGEEHIPTRLKRQFVRRPLCEAQGWLCFYCRLPMEASGGSSVAATLDHVKPVSRGGKNSRRNYVAACGRCNQDKGDMSAEVFGSLRGNYEGRGLPKSVRDKLKNIPPSERRRRANQLAAELRAPAPKPDAQGGR